MTNYDKITIYNLVAAYLGDYNHLISDLGQVDAQSLTLETLSLSINGLLECNQFEKANKLLEQMKKISDDDILTTLTSVECLIREVLSLKSF